MRAVHWYAGTAGYHGGRAQRSDSSAVGVRARLRVLTDPLGVMHPVAHLWFPPGYYDLS